MTFSFEPLRRIMDGLVHATAAGDSLAQARHRSFISSHLTAGLLALMVFPAWLALAGQPSLFAAIAFLWLVAPLPIAAFLSRTGRYGEAHLLSALALTCLVAWISSFTGGAASPALVWLALVPAEAALSGSRRITLGAAGLAGFGLVVMLAAGAAGALPAPIAVPASFGPLIIAAAIVYAGLLALRIERIHAEAEAALRLGDGRYRLLADNATDLITRHGPAGDIEFASPAARSVAGCAPSDLQGNGLFDRVHVADRPAYLRALSEAERTGETVTVEFRLRHGDGARFVWIEMRCRPVLEATGPRRTVVAVARDVTSRKDQEMAFAEARAIAEQANRTKGQFLANMSHELRTPLNAIIGFSDILEQQLFGRFEFQRHHDYARLIRSSGEHLLSVVNSILDMSKIEAGKFDLHAEPFPVAALVDGSLEMMSQQISSRGLRLSRRIEPGMPDLVADRRACRQVLINLLSNAIKFTEPGGTVTVSARTERDMVVLQVSDTGIGISGPDLPRLGTPFVQADADIDRRYEGTGLGLSVVKGLIALHGGTFQIESELGRGTTATVRLPRAAGASPEFSAVPSNERERKIA